MCNLIKRVHAFHVHFVWSIAIHVRRGCTGQGSGGILRVRWNCNGEEPNLLNCSMVENNRTKYSDCIDHKTDAGVYCSG
jgi:hypothetical protein